MFLSFAFQCLPPIYGLLIKQKRNKKKSDYNIAWESALTVVHQNTISFHFRNLVSTLSLLLKWKSNFLPPKIELLIIYFRELLITKATKKYIYKKTKNREWIIKQKIIYYIKDPNPICCCCWWLVGAENKRRFGWWATKTKQKIITKKKKEKTRIK